jgi:hypothetical protein
VDAMEATPAVGGRCECCCSLTPRKLQKWMRRVGVQWSDKLRKKKDRRRDGGGRGQKKKEGRGRQMTQRGNECVQGDVCRE